MGSMAQQVVDVLGKAVPHEKNIISQVVENIRNEGRRLESIDIAYRLCCWGINRNFIIAATELSDTEISNIEHILQERWRIAENMIDAKLNKKVIEETTGILEINLQPLIREACRREYRF
ncbi:MAG: hypothetical protein AB2989_06200 [Candidatus Symbiodolus clandestinus]